jgi:hypothetical protein
MIVVNIHVKQVYEGKILSNATFDLLARMSII